MARGWESKSVEDQIADAQARGAHQRRPNLTPEERDRESRRMTLQLARARALQDLQGTCDRRHRALLEDTVAHLEAELQQLVGPHGQHDPQS